MASDYQAPVTSAAALLGARVASARKKKTLPLIDTDHTDQQEQLAILHPCLSAQIRG